MANKAIFTDVQVQASISNILWALETLTNVEFRMWVEMCKAYPNTHPNHFEGKEEQYVLTGTWELPEPAILGSPPSA